MEVWYLRLLKALVKSNPAGLEVRHPCPPRDGLAVASLAWPTGILPVEYR